jgi:hypothetical protein
MILRGVKRIETAVWDDCCSYSTDVGLIQLSRTSR